MEKKSSLLESGNSQSFIQLKKNKKYFDDTFEFSSWQILQQMKEDFLNEEETGRCENFLVNLKRMGLSESEHSWTSFHGENICFFLATHFTKRDDVEILIAQFQQFKVGDMAISHRKALANRKHILKYAIELQNVELIFAFELEGSSLDYQFEYLLNHAKLIGKALIERIGYKTKEIVELLKISVAVVRDQKLRNSSKSLKRLFFEDSNQKIRNPLLIQQLLEFEIPQPDIFLCFTYLVQNPFSDDCTTLEIVNYFLETLLKKKWQSLLRKRNAKEIQYLIGSDPESAITVQGLGNSTLYSMILLNGPPSLIDNDFLKHSFRIRGSGWVCLIALISLFIYGLTSTYIVFGLLRSPNTPPLLTKAIDNQLLDDQFSGTQKSESLTWFLETLIPKLFNTDNDEMRNFFPTLAVVISEFGSNNHPPMQYEEARPQTGFVNTYGKGTTVSIPVDNSTIAAVNTTVYVLKASDWINENTTAVKINYFVDWEKDDFRSLGIIWFEFPQSGGLVYHRRLYHLPLEYWECGTAPAVGVGVLVLVGAAVFALASAIIASCVLGLFSRFFKLRVALLIFASISAIAAIIVSGIPLMAQFRGEVKFSIFIILLVSTVMTLVNLTEMLGNVRNFFLSVDNYLDIVWIVLATVIVGYQVWIVAVSPPFCGNDAPGYSQLEDYVISVYAFRVLCVCLLIATAFKVISILSYFNERVGVLVIVLRRMLIQFSTFLFILLPVLILFTLAMYIIFGPALVYAQEAGLSGTFLFIFLTLSGSESLDFFQLNQEDPNFALLFYVGWLIVGFFFLLNLLLAMLNDAFSETKENAAKEYKWSYLKIVEDLQLVFDIVLPKKRSSHL